MTKEEWIAQAKSIIKNNEEIISEIDFMVGTDWSRNQTQMRNAQWENTFLKEGIRLLTKSNKENSNE